MSPTAHTHRFPVSTTATATDTIRTKDIRPSRSKVILPMTSDRYRFLIAIAGLTLILAIGAYLRLFDLGTKSISHPEMYVPGIRMPAGLSAPRERLTIFSVLTGTLSQDVHPPGYYLLMWAWTQYFGTSLWSIRLPSALLGIASIILLFWVGVLTGQKPAGWIAATLLGLNGYHVFWSKAARMFSLACFLGLVGTIFLILLARDSPARRILYPLYAMVILLGLASHIFFWLLIITHILWVAINALRTRQPMPGLLQLQMLLIILASPLLILSLYQSAHNINYLSSNVFLHLREFVQFSYLFPLDHESGVYPAVPFSLLGEYLRLPAVRNIFFVLSCLLLILGLRSGKSLTEKIPPDSRAPSSVLWTLGALCAFLSIIAFIVFERRFIGTPSRTIAIVALLTPLPAILALSATFLERGWSKILNWRLVLRALNGEGVTHDIFAMLVIAPLTILAVIGQFTPIMNQRGMLFLAPYLLFVLARGLVEVMRWRRAGVVLFALLLVFSVESVASYSQGRLDPVDFRAFSSKVTPRITKSDLIFVQRSWYGTPILYYLPANQFQLVGYDYLETIRRKSRPRVWVLSFYTERVSPEIEHALGGYRMLDTIEVPHARAELYVSEASRARFN